jgi:hypothetical protein
MHPGMELALHRSMATSGSIPGLRPTSALLMQCSRFTMNRVALVTILAIYPAGMGIACSHARVCVPRHRHVGARAHGDADLKRREA